MCGHPVHRIDWFEGERYCYMDGFCDNWDCKCNHPGECDCPPVVHDCNLVEDEFCYECTIVDDFFEQDQPVEEVKTAFSLAEKAVTKLPSPIRRVLRWLARGAR